MGVNEGEGGGGGGGGGTSGQTAPEAERRGSGQLGAAWGHAQEPGGDGGDGDSEGGHTQPGLVADAGRILLWDVSGDG